MSPKPLLLAACLLSAAALARAAEYKVTLSDVHLCCKSCVNDAEDAVAPIAGASVDADKAAKTVTITASSQGAAQQAVDALVAAGFYGASSDPAIHVANAGGQDRNVSGLKVGGVHLCCKGCVTGLNKAVAKVKGVTGTTAVKDAESFEIMGNFNAREVIDALHAAGFSAKVE